MESRLRRLYERFWGSDGGSVFRSAAFLSGGTATGLILVGLSLPILSRLYSAADFGTYAVYTSVLSLLLVTSAMRYELAIPLPEDESDGLNLLILSLGIVVLVAALVTIGVYLVDDEIARWTKTQLVLPVGLAAAGAYQALSLWGVRSQAFRALGTTIVVQRTAQVATQVVLGFSGRLSGGLVVGDTVGRSCASAVLGILLLRRIRGVIWGTVSLREMRRLAARYKRFPQFTLAASLANTASTQLPFILLAALYGRTVTGYFAVAEAMGSFVHNVVATPVAQAYMREAVEAWRRGPLELQSLYIKTMRKLAIIGLVPAVALLVGVRYVAPVALGSAWLEAGQYAQVLSFGFYAVFLAQPLSRTLIVMELQPLQLAWDVTTLVATTLALTVADQIGFGGYGAVTAYSIALFAVSGTYVLVPLLAIRRRQVRPGDAEPLH